MKKHRGDEAQARITVSEIDGRLISFRNADQPQTARKLTVRVTTIIKMAHLWIKDDTDRWCVMPLDAQAFALSQNPPRGMRDPDESVFPALLVQQTNVNPSRWILVVHPGGDVRVNGDGTTLGVRVLTDRDEINVADVGAFFFSTESLARIESFPGSAQKIYCPRCRQVLDEGVPAVKCPQCGVWYHETEELNCWRYAETCALCPQPTELDAGFRWTPEEL